MIQIVSRGTVEQRVSEYRSEGWRDESSKLSDPALQLVVRTNHVFSGSLVSELLMKNLVCFYALTIGVVFVPLYAVI